MDFQKANKNTVCSSRGLTLERNIRSSRLNVRIIRLNDETMPELPEVETVARQLETSIVGRIVKDVDLHDAKLGVLPDFEIIGAKLERVRRIAKQIVLSFRFTRSEKAENELFFLVVHLRMTGRLLWVADSADEPFDTKDQKFVRATIHFEGGKLHFADVRRFGTFEFYKILPDSIFPVGMDPTTADYDLPKFRQSMKNRSQSIKMFLLRQDILVGMGNIYVCEALFRSGIKPDRSTQSLTSTEQKRLFEVIPELLEEAIEMCGTTFSDFQNARGVEGQFQTMLQVYKREGEPCRVCGNPILRMSQQGRSSFYCGNCQK